VSGYRVEKQSYSRGAWRVLDADTGEQVYRNEVFDHPFMGRINLSGPVCFDRKRDAVAWVEAEIEPNTATTNDDERTPT
jgi:hypothetical protein